MPDRAEIWKAYKQAVLEKVGDFSVLFEGLAKQKSSADGWVTALCPFHEDHNPSFAFNTSTGKWCCFAGCGKGGPVDFLMQSSGTAFKETLVALGDRVGVPRPASKTPQRPPIPETLVKEWTENLWKNEEVVRWLREKRGLSDETLRRFQIGWDPKRQRNTIPVRDERGNPVNVRLYNAKKDPKIINYTEGKWKYGSPARMYGVDLLREDTRPQTILCEGEFDRIVLMQEGFLGVTGTHGCSTFRPEWVEHFTGRDVVIMYDCDPEGRTAVNRIVLPAFKTAVESGKVKSIKDVVLPLRGDKDDKDVTDFFHKRGFTAADLKKVIDETPAYSYAKEEKAEEVIDLSSFTEVERKDLIDKKVRCEITICGETSDAFHAVERFRVTFCPRLRKGECFDCAEPIVIPRGAQEYIGSCMSTNFQQKSMLRDFCCRYGQKPGIDITQRTTVKEFFCHQKINRIVHTKDSEGNLLQFIDGKRQELLEKRVYFLSSEHPKPGNYLATGWVKSHPKTQQVTFLIESLEPQEDDFEAFRVEDNIENLRAMKSLTFRGIIDSLRENVTRIYERDEILTAILLTYCSPRWMIFNEKLIRGWLVTIILGDAGSGKTQTFQAVSEFMSIGDIVSGLTASRTGLAYALVEHKQKGWQVKIGRYPANTRKLLAVDEVQFIPDWDLRTISKAMEEGFLQIDRVQSKGYESQTRLVLIGNPKGDCVMDDFSFGCDALEGLFAPTILRRTDLAVMANYGDLKDLSFINKRFTHDQAAPLKPEMLRSLVYWAWNLQPEQITFEADATEACLKSAIDLSDKFGHATKIPLITLSDARNKIARIAAAFAVLDVSGDENFKRLIIKPEHVRAASMFLEDLYEAENCQLNKRSFITRMETQVVDYDEIEAAFLEKKQNEKYGSGENASQFTRAVWILYLKDCVRLQNLAEQVGCRTEGLTRTIRLLKKFSLLDSDKNGYRKTPKFNKFLRRFLKGHPDFFAEKDVPDAE